MTKLLALLTLLFPIWIISAQYGESKKELIGRQIMNSVPHETYYLMDTGIDQYMTYSQFNEALQEIFFQYKGCYIQPYGHLLLITPVNVRGGCLKMSESSGYTVD